MQTAIKKTGALQYIGIDGCRSGWFYAGMDPDGIVWFDIITGIDHIQQFADKDCVILIDIPMGLKKGPGGRACDREARKLLKKKGSSIFPAPSRAALAAATYREACRLNQKHTGKKLSIQSFNIMSKIREVDQFLRNPKRTVQLYEFHPELGFLALNQFKPLTHSKKTPEGRQERTAVLECYVEGTSNIISRASQRFLRKHLALDDIIDALAGLISARFKERLISLPAIADIDEYGIEMTIVYPKVDG